MLSTNPIRALSKGALALWLLIPALGAFANSRFAIIDPAAAKASIHRDGDWIVDHAPIFECSDATLQQIYEFRWAVYHRHIVKTPDGYVVTEFLRFSGLQFFPKELP